MAWPLTPYETAAPGVTVKSTLLNAIQQAINWIFGGTKSIKQIVVDGVGAAATSFASGVIAKIAGGALEADGGAADDQAALVTSSVPTNRKLLWDSDAGAVGTHIHLRIYAVFGGGLDITLNAAWDAGAVHWVCDDFGGGVHAFLLRLTSIASGNFTLKQYDPGAQTFGDGAWTKAGVVDVLTSGLSVTGSLIADIVQANTAKIGTAMPTPACALGQVYKDLVPIGWGRFVVAGAAISMSSGVNVKSAVYNGSGSYTITFGTAPPLPGFHGVAFVTSYSSPDVSFWCDTNADGSGRMVVNVHARSIGGTPASADGSFFLVAFDG